MVFSGTVSTDFMKLGAIPDRKKQEYIDYAGTDFYTLRKNIIDYVKFNSDSISRIGRVEPYSL